MTLRLSIWFTAILCLTGCGAFAAEVSRDMAPLISTEVMPCKLGTEMAPQISTEVAVQLATALADTSATPLTPSELPTEVAQDCNLIAKPKPAAKI